MFIGSNLENIRMINGLSRKDLALKIGVSEQAIWQYETKNTMPDINKMYDIANLFSVKTSYFINKQPIEFQESTVLKQNIAFRAKNQKVSTKILAKQFYQAVYLSNLTNYLFSFIKKPEMSIFHILSHVDELLSDRIEVNRRNIISKSANLTRNLLLTNSNNSELLFNIEKAGIVVYEKSIDSEVDAFSFWSNNQTPFIVLGNNKGVAVRRNFDIAHELGHLILHRNIQYDMLSNEEYKEIEREADIFASELLLPKVEFTEDFKKISKKSNPDYLKILKEKWCVSIQAIAMRAYYLGLMSDSQYRYFWASINKMGYKQLEPLDEKLELPQPVKINSLIKFYFDKEILTPISLINHLNIEPEFLKNIAGINLKLFETYSNPKKQENILNLFV